MKRIKFLLIKIPLYFFSSLFPATGEAQIIINICPTNEFSRLCDISFETTNVIGFFIQLLLITALLSALIFLIWGGIKWILSGGDKTKIESARSTIIGAVIGLIIAFASFFIINIIAQLFGISNILELELPKLLP